MEPTRIHGGGASLDGVSVAVAQHGASVTLQRCGVRLVSLRPLPVSGKWVYAEEWELRNTSGARIIRTVTHSEARSLGAEVSAELSVNMGQLIAEANAKISAKISASASYTTTTQETVEVPAFTSLVYRRGVGHRKITVSESQVHRDCSQTELKTVTLKGATNLSVARPL